MDRDQIIKEQINILREMQSHIIDKQQPTLNNGSVILLSEKIVELMERLSPLSRSDI